MFLRPPHDCRADRKPNTPDLRTRQIALKEEALSLGIDQYKKERERFGEADTGPGNRLMRDAIGLVATGIEHFAAVARKGSR